MKRIHEPVCRTRPRDLYRASLLISSAERDFHCPGYFKRNCALRLWRNPAVSTTWMQRALRFIFVAQWRVIRAVLGQVTAFTAVVNAQCFVNIWGKLYYTAPMERGPLESGDGSRGFHFLPTVLFLFGSLCLISINPKCTSQARFHMIITKQHNCKYNGYFRGDIRSMLKREV